MQDGYHTSRRRLLSTLGAGLTATLAGCPGDQGNEPSQTSTGTRSPTDTASPTDTPTRSPTETEEEETETTTEEPWEIDPVEHDKLIGAHYMQWYRGDEGIEGSRAVDGRWSRHTPVTPELGSYNSLEEDVINQQVKWAREHGINWFITSGHSHLEDVWDAELTDEMNWSILIGGARFDRNDHGAVDFDQPANRQKLVDEIGYMADRFFDDPRYLEIDDRPVVYLYAMNVTSGGLYDAFAAAEQRAGTDVYWIADFPTYRAPGDRERHLPTVDALSTFTPYRPIINDSPEFTDMPEFIDTAEERLRTNRLAADDMDYTFIPTVTPGYDDNRDARKTSAQGRDDTGTHPVLERDPDAFEEYGRTAIDYMDPELKAIIVSTWNGWLETTSIEPTEEEGTAFLEATRDGIATADPDYMDPGTYTEVALDFDHTGSFPRGLERHPALRLTGLTATDGNDDILTYDVEGGMDDHILHNLDHPDQRIYFSQGCYSPFDANGARGRWLGGDAETARLYLDTPEEPDTLTLRGAPLDRDITAQVRYDGEHVGELAFDDGQGEYLISID